MNGAQDLGGAHGFGPVAPEPDEPRELLAVARQHPQHAAADGAGAEKRDLDRFHEGTEADRAPAFAGVTTVGDRSGVLAAEAGTR